MANTTIYTDHLTRIPLDRIRPNPYQPEGRLEFAADVVEQMAASILEHGLIFPAVARFVMGEGRISQDEVSNGHYEVADGWLRYKTFCWLKAAGHAGFDELPCIIRELTDQQMADMVLEANTVRKDLTAIDKAHLFKKYLEDFKITQAELAERHHCSQGEIGNTIRLLELPADIQAKIISQEITETAGRQLLRLAQWPELQQKTAKDAEKQTVNDLSNNITRDVFYKTQPLENSSDVIFDAQTCEACEKRQKIGEPYSGNKKTWRCFDKACWEKKNDEASKARAKSLQDSGVVKSIRDMNYRQFKNLTKDYEMSRIDNPGECKECLRRVQAKDHDEAIMICVDMKCWDKKEKAKQTKDAEEKKAKEEALDLRMKTACHSQAENQYAALSTIAAIMTKDMRQGALKGAAKILGLPSGGNIDDLQDEINQSVNYENALEIVLILVVANRRWVNEYTSTGPDVNRMLLTMEGKADEYLTACKAFQEENCRGCSLPSKELAKIGTGERCCYHSDLDISQGGKCQYRGAKG
jgi:ParB/RepB/Spo0J family partition protein